jgi:Mg-chelatase subunit ChlD
VTDSQELSRRQTWALGGTVFVLAALGTFASQYLSGAYESPDRAVGLVIGSALVGLSSALPVVVLLPLVQDLLKGIAENWRTALAVLLAGVVTVWAVLGLGPVAARLTNEWWGCEPRAEFTVVTTPAVRNTADDLLAAFERSTARANDGCPTGHGFVYEASEEAVVETIGHGWVVPPDKTSFPLRDVGPRPDIWLTESTLPIKNLYAYGDPEVKLDARSFGLSRVVLAIPPGAPRPPDGDPLPALVASQPEGVVRPDPAGSTVGLLATAALYEADLERPPAPVDDARKRLDLATEQRLGVARSPFPDGDEGALLCRFGRLTGPRPALLLSEQAVERFNADKAVGGPCDVPDRPYLRAVYPQTAVLDHQVVRLDWAEGPASPRVAADFATWLASDEGKEAVRDTGLVPTTPGDKASDTLSARGDLDPKAVSDVRLRYVQAHRPRRDLLALDYSGSMARPGRVPDRTRAQVVAQAVADACPVREGDEIGLWVFPDASDRRPRPVTPLAQDGCDAVRRALPTLQPGGGTPLLQTLVEGVDALARTDDTAERRLVVVTDGEDTGVGVARDEVLQKLADAQVKVYVVTLGDITCAADPLQEIAERTGGRCYNPGYTTEQVRDALGG